jgi:hypothetical protein
MVKQEKSFIVIVLSLGYSSTAFPNQWSHSAGQFDTKGGPDADVVSTSMKASVPMHCAYVCITSPASPSKHFYYLSCEYSN